MYPTLISPEWLEAHHNSTDIRIFDATLHEDMTLSQAKHVFSKKHVKNSYQLILREENATYDQVPKPQVFTKLATSQGLTRGVHAVIYDSDGKSAIRAWWLLQYYSHPKVSILLGGLDAWSQRDFPVELKKLVKPSPAPETAFYANPRPGVVVGAEEVNRYIQREKQQPTVIENLQFQDSIQQYELATDQKSVLAKLDLGDLEPKDYEIKQLVLSDDEQTDEYQNNALQTQWKLFLDEAGWFRTDILKIKSIFRQNGVNIELPITVTGNNLVDILHVVLAAFLCSGKGIDGLSVFFGGWDIFKNGIQKVFDDAGIIEKAPEEADDE
ncbi:3-mercaptopyruvate sulfurtransferase / Thiosulfate sulfurtransferase [Spironucleus salmonicida]|uniref:Thiosulfate sulfurtransferase n=1 Tax=Spironucleus salmonicida TaxID=348837 RepID=V6LIR2_9EUKA|nr:3-mercaptopyruvate sulfurtransferase / Thiosulfate sulfurtransferase [Spironucleus salmonicida]|eukprot:EST44490.1 Thiosulfate sulfurtransferase [Spironucleus salmonicida]